MHYENWMWRRCSALLPMSPSGHSWYCNENSPCSPQSIFPIEHHCKRDVCKTVDRTPPAVNMVSYYSLYCIFLSHGGLICVKLFQSPEKSFFLNDLIAVEEQPSWARGMMGYTLLHIFIGAHNPEAWNFFGVCARRAALLALNRHHFRIQYPVVIIHPWLAPNNEHN